jgi:hypothetical protein
MVVVVGADGDGISLLMVVFSFFGATMTDANTRKRITTKIVQIIKEMQMIVTQ